MTIEDPVAATCNAALHEMSMYTRHVGGMAQGRTTEGLNLFFILADTSSEMRTDLVVFFLNAFAIQTA